MGGSSSLPEGLLRELPVVYATILRMRAEGADARMLAEVVNVTPDAIELLVEVAERKLRRLTGERSTQTVPLPPTPGTPPVPLPPTSD